MEGPFIAVHPVGSVSHRHEAGIRFSDVTSESRGRGPDAQRKQDTVGLKSTDDLQPFGGSAIDDFYRGVLGVHQQIRRMFKGRKQFEKFACQGDFADSVLVITLKGEGKTAIPAPKQQDHDLVPPNRPPFAVRKMKVGWLNRRHRL